MKVRSGIFSETSLQIGCASVEAKELCKKVIFQLGWQIQKDKSDFILASPGGFCIPGTRKIIGAPHIIEFNLLANELQFRLTTAATWMDFGAEKRHAEVWTIFLNTFSSAIHEGIN